MDNFEKLTALQNEIAELTSYKNEFVKYCNVQYGAKFRPKDFIDESYDFSDLFMPSEDMFGWLDGFVFEMSFDDIIEFLKWRCSQYLLTNTKSVYRAVNGVASIYLNNPNLTAQGLAQLYEHKVKLKEISKIANLAIEKTDNLIKMIYDKYKED